MGQKVSPIGFRVGVYRGWDARWYADKEYTKLLHEDLAMRRIIKSRLRNASVSRIETERSENQLTIVVRTAKPGIVIGKQGAAVDSLRDELERMSGKRVRISIFEIKVPELDAQLVAENVAAQLEKRIAFRRALKQSIMRSMRAGAIGVKVAVSGRLGGSEMSRREWDMQGRVPLHTLRANIDYGQAAAHTNAGKVGVTCWLYLGDFVTATGEALTGLGTREAVEVPDLPQTPAAPSKAAAMPASVPEIETSGANGESAATEEQEAPASKEETTGTAGEETPAATTPAKTAAKKPASSAKKAAEATADASKAKAAPAGKAASTSTAKTSKAATAAKAETAAKPAAKKPAATKPAAAKPAASKAAPKTAAKDKEA